MSKLVIRGQKAVLPDMDTGRDEESTCEIGVGPEIWDEVVIGACGEDMEAC